MAIRPREPNARQPPSRETKGAHQQSVAYPCEPNTLHHCSPGNQRLFISVVLWEMNACQLGQNSGQHRPWNTELQLALSLRTEFQSASLPETKNKLAFLPGSHMAAIVVYRTQPPVIVIPQPQTPVTVISSNHIPDQCCSQEPNHQSASTW